MKPGTITVTSWGTRQGIFRPMMRVYYSHARHGILFEEIQKPLRCRDRSAAIKTGREWRKSEDGIEALRALFVRIASNPDNTIPAFTH